MTRILTHRPPLQTHSPFAGEYGCAVYVSAPDASGPELIRYRRSVYWGRRVPLQTRGRLGTESLERATPALAIVKAPNQPSVALPDAYKGHTAWINVRPHRDGIELPTLQGALQIKIDTDGDAVPLLDGRGELWKIELLAGGGVRFRWDWIAGRSAPTAFVVRRVSGPTSPTSKSAAFVAGQVSYSATFEGLSEGEYVFAIDAQRTGYETRSVLNRAGDDEFSVSPDATGPGAVTILSVAER